MTLEHTLFTATAAADNFTASGIRNGNTHFAMAEVMPTELPFDV